MAASTSVLDALRDLARGEWVTAASTAQQASLDQPDSRLAAALAAYLDRLGAFGVYDEPAAFEAFIGGGGNVELYRQTTERLAVIHEEARPASFLDIGCGDGRVTAAAMHCATTRVDLVEPSAELLDRAVASVTRPGVEVVGHNVHVTTFLAGLHPSTSWDLVQATFALHATDPGDRPNLFAGLARRTPLLVFVEFDVPAFADRSDEHLAYLADRYELGIREYDHDQAVVEGFLLPVLVGQVDPTRPRFTFEQPISQWTALATDVGLQATIEPVAPYWWADAVLVAATRPGG